MYLIRDALEGAIDKMGLNTMRFRMFCVLFSIAFPVVLTVTLMYQNSSFGIFEGFSKSQTELLTGRTNVTNNTLGFGGGRVQNVTHESSGGQNASEVKGQNGKTQNDTATNGRTIVAAPHSHPGEVKGQQRQTQKGTATNERTIIAAHPGSTNASSTSSTNNSTTQTGLPDNKEKLLHGLLASGFDEASCRSRMQSHSYRKASPHKPSPYLISKLRNYEEIHRRCGPNSRFYGTSMMKIFHSKHKGSAPICKYLVWTPANGLGNQMISIAATFLYAVLTERVLLLKFGKDKHNLFCEPFLNSTWILPHNSPFWDDTHIETYQHILEKDKSNRSKEDLLPSVLFLNLQYTRSDHEKFFHCDHNQDLLSKVPLLILLTDQYFVPSLFMTPIFNTEITKMFPEKDTIFHHLARYLFHPSNEAWEIISKFYQTHLAKADEKIGLQIRVFNPVSTPKQAIMDLVLSCTIKNKLLPEVTNVQNSVSSKNQTTKAVLVASLHPQYGDKLRAMYVKKQTVTGEIIEVYQPSHEEKQKFHDNMHNMKAWIDMYLLSLSDMLMTTSLSTFGYVAQGLGHMKPWLLYRIVTNKTHEPACERDFSMEPCYHLPPKHFCNGKAIKDYLSSFHYLGECKDFYLGVKLFNG